jgi:hypothetical protein
MSQYIFLDESGDLGFNPRKQNSKYFIITTLFAVDKLPVERIVKKVHRTLRKKVKKLSGGILHSVKESPVTRRRLLNLLAEKACSIMVIYLNKSKVYTKLQNEKHVLYNYVTNILLDRIMTKKLLDIHKQITMIAAKRETNRFLNDNFKTYLQTQIGNKHKASIKIEVKGPSEERSLQAVDFASWAIFRKYERKDPLYYDLIKKIIVEENSLFK